MKKFVALIAALGLLGTAGIAFASTGKTPADIVSGLTGRTLEDLAGERSAGKTYGTIAKEAGKLEEFKVQMLEQKKAMLDQRVKDGNITQERADEIYNAIENNQAVCTGTGGIGIGKKYGMNFGQGQGQGPGKGQGFKRGAGKASEAGVQRGMGFGTGMNR